MLSEPTSTGSQATVEAVTELPLLKTGGSEQQCFWNGTLTEYTCSCCNTCEEVRQAYLRKGWSFNDPNGIEQVRSCG